MLLSRFEPEILDPLKFGWRTQENMLYPTMVPEGTQMVPEYIQKIISCGCKSDTPCESMRCGCNKAGVTCTIFCLCQQADAPSTCQNTLSFMSTESDDESSDEEQINED